MKTERFHASAGLAAVFLSVLIGFSGMMCLKDAFTLEADPLLLLGVCGLSALLSVLSCLPKRSWPFGLLFAVLYLAVLIWQRTPLLDSLQTLVHRISWEYHQAFSSVRIVEDCIGDPQWVLIAAAVPVCWITARVLCREGSTALVLLSALPILVLVLLVVDLAPVLWLTVLTGGLLIVVVSHGVRERSRREGGILAWWLVLPTVILLCALTVLWPPADYERADWSEVLRGMTQTAEQVTQEVESWSQSLPSSRVQWSRELKTVNLKKLGPKAMTGRPVLQYRSDGDVRYLRGVSLAVYGDSEWEALPTETFESYEVSDSPLLNSAVLIHTLEVETRTKAPQLYTTYYLASAPENGVIIDDAYVSNQDGRKAYRVLFEPTLQMPLGTSEAADRLAEEVYTQVPETVRAQLEAILAENGLENGSVDAIVDYVRSCGTYDLNTPGIPAGKDFVLYFLQESRQGYCVHFASAAVLLLRTAGIPARYVTGYSVSGGPGQWNTVTEDEAHAWVEYYTPGIGWRPADPTPADESGTAAAVTQTQPQREPEEPNRPTQAEPEKPEQTEQAEPIPESQTDSEKSTPKAWPILLAALLCLPVLIWLRRQIGLRYRRQRCRNGHPNRRALYCWRWLVQLAKAGGADIEEDLLCLAEKAKFSQHTMEPSEIDRLQQAVDGRIRAMKAGSFFQRLWWKYGPILF